MDALSFDAASLHSAYAAGTAPDAVVAEAFRRIADAGDPGVFLHLADRDAVAAQAAELGPFDPVAKPLWGLPFVVKDNIDVAGMPTTAACPAFAYTPDRDAFVVAALRRAGALVLGKTNLDQFATGLVGVRTPHPVPRNAVRADIVPGGSSAGSAVAVSRGFVSFALGTDTAGSGRVPAALNNIVGLKPTLGLISNTGVVPACKTLDTVSIFALCVADATRALDVAAAYDADDPFARPRASFPSSSTLRIGAPDGGSRRFFGDVQQADAFAAALDRLAALGCAIEEVDFAPFYEIAEMLYGGPWVAERAIAIEALLRDRPDVLHPVTRAVIEPARDVSATDAFKAFYRLRALKRRTDAALDAVDALCVPSIPTFPTLEALDADPIGPNNQLGVYTNFVNLLDLCGLAVPTAARADGLPGGVTLLGPAGADAALAALGARLHADADVAMGATGWPLPAIVDADPRPAAEDEIPLAVVGAHMSGLPLNPELTRLGARFLRAARTAPHYRLFRLPGGPPVRPGLIQIDDGARIALEVWALPKARFGDFIQGVPAPLGIGTLTLDDGEQVKGFLCEPIATADAEDVSAYGGWRAFLENRSTPSEERSHA